MAINKFCLTQRKVTLGALGDSFYEYLLKVWIQGGRSEDHYRRMYDDAMDGVDELLVQKVGQHVNRIRRALSVNRNQT